MYFTLVFLEEVQQVIDTIDTGTVEQMVNVLAGVREQGGRLFFIGSGGGAGHASHAVCDFRKMCNFEAYAPYDNVSELTARANDDGWEAGLSGWLQVSRFGKNDCLFVFSVGGGCEKEKISMNLVNAVAFAREIGAPVVGIVGKDGGYTKEKGDAVVVIPTVNPGRVTPLTEGFQAVIWHLLVSHPVLQKNPAKWEGSATPAS